MYIFSRDLGILEHRITPEGRFPTNKGTEAILAMPRSHSVASVKRSLGMVGYFMDYVKNMSTRTKYLRSLLQKGVPKYEQEIVDLKAALTSPDTVIPPRLE